MAAHSPEERYEWKEKEIRGCSFCGKKHTPEKENRKRQHDKIQQHFLHHSLKSYDPSLPRKKCNLLEFNPSGMHKLTHYTQQSLAWPRMHQRMFTYPLWWLFPRLPPQSPNSEACHKGFHWLTSAQAGTNYIPASHLEAVKGQLHVGQREIFPHWTSWDCATLHDQPPLTINTPSKHNL